MYLDPAFGGMLLQVIVAVVAAGGVFLVTIRKKISAFFSKNKDGEVAETSGNQDFDTDSDDDVIDMISDDNGSADEE
ncbi:MAG: hypothetical protein FWD44_01745 [Oscillospiraceae bacterium]|nr:hypothetical protein [Oscillospiraceae bacterium]